MINLTYAKELARGCAGDFDTDSYELFVAIINELEAARNVTDAAGKVLLDASERKYWSQTIGDLAAALARYSHWTT